MRSDIRTRSLAIAVQAGAIAAIGLFGSAPAGAGGLLLYEVGTADIRLASAGYTARAQDASTVFTNPAGMTRLDGTQVVLGAQLLFADLVFSIGQDPRAALGSGDGGNPVGFFPGGGLFLSYSVSPDLKLGFAATGNFGLAQKYDSNWVGRYYVQEATLIGMSLLPSAAWRVSKEVAVGASLNAVYGVLKQQVAVNNIVGPDGQMSLDTNAWGFGVNLGLLYEPSDATRFGVTYNSQVKLDFSAPAEFSGLSPVLEALLRSRGLLNATLDIPIYVPQGVNAGVSHRLDDRWTLLGSVGWQQWSKFGQVELGVHSTTNPTTLKTDLDFKDTWHVAVGAPARRPLAAEHGDRLRLGFPGQLQRLAGAAGQLGVALRHRRAEGPEQDLQLGRLGRVCLRRHARREQARLRAGHRRRARRPGRLLRQRRHVLPVGHLQLEALARRSTRNVATRAPIASTRCATGPAGSRTRCGASWTSTSVQIAGQHARFLGGEVLQHLQLLSRSSRAG